MWKDRWNETSGEKRMKETYETLPDRQTQGVGDGHFICSAKGEGWYG